MNLECHAIMEMKMPNDQCKFMEMKMFDGKWKWTSNIMLYLWKWKCVMINENENKMHVILMEIKMVIIDD